MYISIFFMTFYVREKKTNVYLKQSNKQLLPSKEVGREAV